MRIAVFGTGGVGGYFGGRLAAAGEDVVFIARGEHLRAINRDGLHVDSPDGDFRVFPAQAAEDPKQIGPVDAVILGVKAWQVSQAAEAMRPLMGPETFVVPLQNGVEASSQLAAVLGQEHVFGGFCYIVSFISGPGHIKHGGMKPYIAFAELDNRPSERGQRLLDAFAHAGVTAERPEDIHAAIWGKFLFIASLSGVGAITRAPAGVIRTLPETRQMLEEAVAEIAAVARARRINVKADAVSATMAVIDGLPPQTTASMQRDIMDGRPSELSSQNGAVVRLGREGGVPVPLNEFIYSSLLALEMRARGQVQF
jgi:2-dehydropantoate 2-reductase